MVYTTNKKNLLITKTTRKAEALTDFGEIFVFISKSQGLIGIYRVMPSVFDWNNISVSANFVALRIWY